VPAISALAREIWQATYPGIITQEQIDFMLEQRYGHERLYDDLEDADKWLDQAFHDGRRVGFAFSEITRASSSSTSSISIRMCSARASAGS
jgi:hypothetical protein